MSLIPFGFWGQSSGPIVLSTGLRGARYVDYFNDVPLWFNSAALHGDVHLNRTIIDFSSNADYYSWEWMGYFLAPTTGVYTFYTHSDDASYLWIGDAALNPTVGNALVNNGGLHGMVEVSATVNLTAGRYYAMRVQFGEAGGGDAMVVSFAGPGISKTENGSGYYFGGQEVWRNNWIGGVGSFDQNQGGSGGGGGGIGGSSGIVHDQLICYLDSRFSASYPGGGTTWTDLSNNNAHGAMTAAFWTGAYQGHPGFMQMAQNSAHYIDVNLNGVDSTTPVLTVEMWVRPYDTGAMSGMLFGFWVYDFYRTQTGYGFNTAVGDQRGCYTSRLRNEDWWYSQWHHIVCVMYQTSSYNNNKIYINGRLYDSPEQISGTEDTGNRSFANGQMRINGWRTNTSYPFQQDVTVFRVYKKELSAAEVLQNFNVDRAQTYFNKKAVRNFIQNGCKIYLDFEGENDWYTSNGSYVRDYSGVMQFANLGGGVAWNAAGGGNMQLRAANSRRIDLNRNASWLGIFYGSFTFVMVAKFLSTAWTEFLFGSNNALNSQENVNLSLVGNRIRHSHNSGGAPDTFAGFGAMASETWYHITSSYDYNTYVVKIYLNGVPIVTNGFQERVIANQAYFLNQVAGTYYNYDLGLFMAYNRVLSDSEVTTLFNAQKTRFGL